MNLAMIIRVAFRALVRNKMRAIADDARHHYWCCRGYRDG